MSRLEGNYMECQDDQHDVKLRLLITFLVIGTVSIFVVTSCSSLPTDSVLVAIDDSSIAEDSPADVTSTDQIAGSDASGTDQELDEVVGTFESMPVGYTQDGHIFRGNPDAPITVYEFSDYQCPFCARHFAQTEPALNETYVQGGQIRIVFMDFPLVQIHPNAPMASTAALCAGEQSPVAFWKMHSLIFETQNDWENSVEPMAFFEGLSSQLDIDSEAFAKCLESGRTEAVIERSYATGRALGFSGTPSFQFVVEESGESYNLVGAQPFDRFASWIDALAAGEVPPEARQTADEAPEGEPQIPFWATEEGLAADPDKPGYTMAGDTYRGSLDAEVVIVEYSDYQCPFCKRHTTQTQPTLDSEFVDTGQVRWVFKHFPLNIHPQAPMAGVAAECAGEQGQFWEMHELLFESVPNWSVRDPKPALLDLSEELGLDAEAFDVCLDDESIMARVESDFAEGRPFVQGTPTFIVMAGGQGRIIPGALPAETFVQAVQEIIDSVK